MGKSFDLSLVLDFIPELLRYLHITLIVLGGSIVFGLVGGVLLAVPRLYRIPVLSQFATLLYPSCGVHRFSSSYF